MSENCWASYTFLGLKILSASLRIIHCSIATFKNYVPEVSIYTAKFYLQKFPKVSVIQLQEG